MEPDSDIHAPESLSDEDLAIVARLRRGGEKALAELFMVERARLQRMISLRLDRRLAQRVDASDILQEGYVDASKRLEEYTANPTMPFFVWLRFLMTQRLAAVHRWHFSVQKRDPRREQMEPTPDPARDTGFIAMELSASLTSPSRAASRSEMAEQIQHLLDGMDPVDREILILRHFEELTNNEAASELGLTKGATSKRYIRALAKLKGIADPLNEGGE